MRFSAKDPSDVDDFEIDFSAQLADGETISSATVAATGVDKDSDSVVGDRVTFRLSGGTLGEASIKVTVQTSSSRTIERTASLPIKNL